MKRFVINTLDKSADVAMKYKLNRVALVIIWMEYYLLKAMRK